MSVHKVRNATTEDVEAINRLYNEIAKEDNLLWNKSRPVSHHQDWLEKLNQYEYPCLVAHDSGEEIVGYAAFVPWVVNSRPLGLEFMVELQCFVASDYRRQKIGSNLFEELCGHPLSIRRSIYLVCSKFPSFTQKCNLTSDAARSLTCNESAQEFARRNGFFPCGQ